MPIPVTFEDVSLMMPLFVVALGAVVIPVVDVFVGPDTDRGYAGYLTAAVIGLAFLLNGTLGFDLSPTRAFSGLFWVDGFGVFGSAVCLWATGMAALLGIGYFREHGLHRGEFYGLLLVSCFGMMMMCESSNFLSFFIGLEVMSIPVYALCAYQRHLHRSIESAMKYFLMGAFSTAFLLMGIAFLYGGAGSVDFLTIGFALKPEGGVNSIALIGVFFVLIGFGFKVAAVPFHMWTPDAYEGAPTPVTTFMAAAVKAASFIGFFRIFANVLYPLKAGDTGWFALMWTVAIGTMTLGNLAALLQDNVKRMLAYSSIAHAGYLLIGLLTLADNPVTDGSPAVLYYLLAYAVMNIGAFGVVILMGRRDRENLLVSKGWAGIGLRYPLLGVAMSLFLFSLAGIPPTAGFLGKFYLFRSAILQGYVVIALVAVANSLVSVYYYLRIMVVMYMTSKAEGEEEITPLSSIPVAIVLLLAAILTLGLGIWPSPVIETASQAAATLWMVP